LKTSFAALRSAEPVFGGPAGRLFYRKILKAFDLNAVAQASQDHHIQVLEGQLQQKAVTRRKKVVPDPNTTFAGIKEIRVAQMQATHEARKAKARAARNSLILRPEVEAQRALDQGFEAMCSVFSM
jgi:hypothetical protein